MTALGFFRRWWLVVVVSMVIAGSAVAQPFIIGFGPDFGPPGTQVTIVGTGLRSGVNLPIVQFGNVTADIVSANPAQIVAVAPENVPTGPITVTVLDFPGAGQYTTPFNFFAPPRIEDFGTKVIGPGFPLIFEKPVLATPGSTLTIVGGNFFVPNRPGLLVKVGSTFLNATATADTQIQAAVPAALETGYVSVQTVVGTTTNTTDYVYGPPRISGFTPQAAAGDIVDISGLNFLVQTPSQITVRFGGITAPLVDVLSNTNLTAIVPANGLSGPVTVSVPGGSFITTSNFLMLPTVTSFTPKSGGPATTVTLLGSGLAGTTTVLFGTSLASSVANLSSAQVTAVTPPDVISGKITLITLVGTNVTDDLFYAPPKVNGFDPQIGGSGMAVTILGLNFLGATSVQLNGLQLPQFTVIDNTKIAFAVPPNATTGRIKVITPGGTNESAASFTVQGPGPAINSFSPKFGAAGTKVTLIGQNLGPVTNVAFNGIKATVTLQSSSSIEVTVPASATTGKIRVSSPDGVAETTEDFVIGDSADLRLTFGASVNPAVAYGSVTFNLLVVNNGPLPAANTQIQVQLPPNLAFVAANGTAPFTVNGQNVTFSRGSMDPQALFTGSVQVNAGGPTNVIVTAQATSTTPDLKPGDNQRQINLLVALPALAAENVPDLGLLLSWSSAAGTNLYTLQSTTNLNGVFAPVAGQATDDGSTLQLVVPTTNSAAYFRLNLNSQ